MKLHCLSLLTVSLISTAQIVQADGYVLGAGRWDCARAIDVYENGTALNQGELFGWLMGYWTGATFARETGFIDRVEAAGGKAIANATIKECRSAPPETMIFRVANAMIKNTK